MGPNGWQWVRACECLRLDDSKAASDAPNKQRDVYRILIYLHLVNICIHTDLMQRFKLDSLTAGLPKSHKKQVYLTKSTTFAGAQTALNIFKEVAGKTGVPGLQEGVKALVIVLDVMQVRLSLLGSGIVEF